MNIQMNYDDTKGTYEVVLTGAAGSVEWNGGRAGYNQFHRVFTEQEVEVGFRVVPEDGEPGPWVRVSVDDCPSKNRAQAMRDMGFRFGS